MGPEPGCWAVTSKCINDQGRPQVIHSITSMPAIPAPAGLSGTHHHVVFLCLFTGQGVPEYSVTWDKDTLSNPVRTPLPSSPPPNETAPSSPPPYNNPPSSPPLNETVPSPPNNNPPSSPPPNETAPSRPPYNETTPPHLLTC